ncbi:XRE family transcriptional regulator [Streptomyces sp. NPDC047042]|uniref:XRE family transcriptional regulator n=1 Tax=Streptomyces sp. NPDC047042 TaxID=3154807 RepID=UPI0033FC5777
MEDQERSEDFAQLLARLKATYGVNESEIARRIGVAPATVNSWTNRTRGGKRGVRPSSIRALAGAFPKFTEEEIFRAANRVSPGPLSADSTKRVVEIYERLTAEQQKSFEAQMRAVDELNRTGQ